MSEPTRIESEEQHALRESIEEIREGLGLGPDTQIDPKSFALGAILTLVEGDVEIPERDVVPALQENREALLDLIEKALPDSGITD